MFFRTLGLVTLCVTLTACNITGTAQKGPFKAGSNVSTTQLDNQASPISSTTINTQVSGTQGDFSVDGIEWSGWTELVATGQYFDEYENSDSDSALTLSAITNKNRRFDTANINLLTHLAAARMRQHVANGQNRNRAWRSTQNEIKQVFDLQRVSSNINRGVEQLDLLRGNGSFRRDNANLLLFTGAFLATGGNDTSLQSLVDDFADDAEFNGVGVNTFNNIAIKAGEAGLLEKLSNNLKANGASNPPNDGDMNALPSWVNTDVDVDTVPPVITVTGQTSVTIEQGTPYNDEGATAIDDVDGEVAATAVDGSDIIDTSVIGEFAVTYEATDIAGNTATASRTVIVVEGADNEPPTLTLLGDNPDEVEVDTSGESSYEDPGYNALDNRDEVVNVIVDGEVNLGVLGAYTLTYTASDAAENTTIEERIVNVVDTTPPVIELDGPNPHEIYVDSDEVPAPYVDLGATVTDNYDAELTYEVDLSAVDTTQAGTYIVSYTAQDSSGNQAVEVEREVVVSEVPNQTPTVNAGEDTSVLINTTVTLAGSAIDADGTISSFSWKDENGVEIATTAEFDYVANSVGSHTFTLTVTDDDGASATDEVVVTVILPSPYQIIFVSDVTPVPRNFDADLFIQSMIILTSVVDGSGSPVTNAVPTFDASVVNLSNPGTYPLVFTYVDPYGREVTNTLSVIVENHAPLATSAAIIVDEDSSNNSITLAASDSDIGDTLTYTYTQPQNGSVTGSAPNVVYTPNADFAGSDSFTFTVSDGLASSTGTISITVNDIAEPNSAPEAEEQSLTFEEDSVNNVITLNATDADGDALTFTYSIPSNGTLAGTAPNLTYTPEANFFGTDSFEFTVSDGIDSDTATVNINVTDVAEPNQPPIVEVSANPIVATRGESVTLSSIATDEDGNIASYRWEISGDSNYSNEPSFEFDTTNAVLGDITFTLIVEDDDGATAQDSVVITVEASPLAPSTMEFSFELPLEIEVGEFANVLDLYAYIESQTTIYDDNGGVFVDESGSYSFDIESFRFEDEEEIDPNVASSGIVYIYYFNEFGDGIESEIEVTVNELPRVIPVLTQVQIDNYLSVINSARSEARSCGVEGSFPAATALTWSDKLYKAAYEHSQDMAQTTEFDAFSHDGSNTANDWTGSDLGRASTLTDRVATYEYEWQAISENIAAGTNRDTAQDAIDAWLASDGHCANLMSTDVTEVGMALASNTGSIYTNYWTQNFGKPIGYIDDAVVNIRVTTEDGSVLDGVSVTTGAGTEQSSASGTASLSLTPDQEYVLTLNKDGYATQVSPIKAPLAGEQISLDFTMIQRGAVQTFDAESGGVITGANGASVTIEPESFVIGDGQYVTGDIEVTITPVDVSNPASLAVFPGEFTGTQLDGTNTPIISFGTVEYKFSQGGQEVQLAEGATADILIPIYISNYQNGQPIQAGDEIPLWSLNEQTGIWTQESVGTRSAASGYGLVVSDSSSPTGLALQATVSHFTWWNCDVSMEVGKANVTVIGSSQGTAKIRAVASEACNIGWRPRIVDMVVNIGETASNLDIPSSCEVCFSADVSLSAGGFARTEEICETPGPFGNVTIDLLIPDDGPLDIAANANDGPITVNAALGYASSRVQLGSKTFESDVAYSIISGALPSGLSLNTKNSTEAEIVGIPLELGDFSVVVQGANSPDGEIDSVTINYSVVDPSNATLPIFVNNTIYRIMGFGPFGVDLNPYNVGGESTNWSFPLLGDEGFVISSAGLVTYEGQNPGYDTWTGTVRATNAAGFAETTISLCTGDCGGTETPIPGDYALNASYSAYGYEAGEQAALVTVSLNQVSPDDIIVNYTTVDYDSTPAATAGEDYVAVTSSVVIPAGETSVEISVDIIDDDLWEDNNEYFYIDISSPTARIEQGRTTGVVRDNDALIVH